MKTRSFFFKSKFIIVISLITLFSFMLTSTGLSGKPTANTKSSSSPKYLSTVKTLPSITQAPTPTSTTSTPSSTDSTSTPNSTSKLASTQTSTPKLASTRTSTPKLASTRTPTPTFSQTNKNIIGYYTSWSAYSGFTPDKIDASKLTSINYAFANISSDLKIALGDPNIDISNFSKLNALKQSYPNLKTLISVGGWTWSGKFSDVALTDASRIVFANSCVEFILKYGFNGVDLDWEYPVRGGLSTNTVRSQDKQNFTLLLKTIREKLNEQTSKDGKRYLLTIAGGAGTSYVNNTELKALSQYLDYANIMTYDIHGTGDKFTDFNAPLYNNSLSPQYKWSVNSGVAAWLNAGFPANKLVVGIPFYGYKYTGVNNSNNGLYQTYTNSSSISYKNVIASYLNAPGYIRYFDDESKVPWLFNGTTFISYEDQQSIALKAQYIKNKGLSGAMIWELSHDSNNTLLNSLYNNLK